MGVMCVLSDEEMGRMGRMGMGKMKRRGRRFYEGSVKWLFGCGYAAMGLRVFARCFRLPNGLLWPYHGDGLLGDVKGGSKWRGRWL